MLFLIFLWLYWLVFKLLKFGCLLFFNPLLLCWEVLWILTECGWSEDIDCKVVLKRHSFSGLIRDLAILLSGGLSSRKVILVELVLRKVSVI